MAGNTAIAECEAADHGLVLVRFVRALAKRQARLDVAFAFDTANNNAARILN
jgi:hypothetical protein